jgi:hypothetical protein
MNSKRCRVEDSNICASASRLNNASQQLDAICIEDSNKAIRSRAVAVMIAVLLRPRGLRFQYVSVPDRARYGRMMKLCYFHRGQGQKCSATRLLTGEFRLCLAWLPVRMRDFTSCSSLPFHTTLYLPPFATFILSGSSVASRGQVS